MEKTEKYKESSPSIWEVGTTDPDGSVARLEIWGDRRMAYAYAESLAEQTGQMCFVARLDMHPRSTMYIQKDVEPVIPPKTEDMED